MTARGAGALRLDHHGQDLRRRFDPIGYRRLMDAMDGHDVGRGRWGWRRALASARLPVQVIGISSDLLYPPRDQQALAEALPNARLDWLEAPQGHDAFLIEQTAVDRLISRFRGAVAQAGQIAEVRA